MPTPEEFEARSTALRATLRAKLGVTGGSLTKVLKRARPLMPKPVRAAGPVLIEAQQKLTHPKIARYADSGAIDKAFATIEAHLATIDPKERRKDARLRWLALTILNMGVVVLLVVALLRWRGYT